MRSILQNKRGGYTDIFIFMIVTLIVIFVSVLFIYMGGEIEDELHLALDNQSETVDYNQTIEDTFGEINEVLPILYWASLFIIFGMIVAIFIGSYMVQTKPVYFVPYIFIVFIAIILSVSISSAYGEIRATEELSSTFDKFIGANFILAYFPIWIAVISIVGGIIMFVRMRTAQEYPYGFPY